MNRHDERETVFCLLFEYKFNNTLTPDEIMELASELRDFAPTPYIEDTFRQAITKFDELDSLISEYAKGWKITRFSATTSTILRLAMFEILYNGDVPESVAINEAVELAKRYDTDEAPAFINGILGSYSRRQQ